MNDNAELRARRWLAEQLAWERRFEELREAAGIEGAAGFDDSASEASSGRNAA